MQRDPLDVHFRFYNTGKVEEKGQRHEQTAASRKLGLLWISPVGAKGARRRSFSSHDPICIDPRKCGLTWGDSLSVSLLWGWFHRYVYVQTVYMHRGHLPVLHLKYVQFIV